MSNPIPSSFSIYASRFLAGNQPESQQIFRSTSPSSPTHDPFLSSPSASHSRPHLPGSSKFPSPTGTPPFPGPGIEDIPSIDDHGASLGVLFSQDGDQDESSDPVQRSRPSVPNPYAASSSSEDELEPDLDQIAAVRHSLKPNLARNPSANRQQRGWMAHQSVFPPSSSSSADESDKETEAETDDEAPPANLHEPLLNEDTHVRATKAPVRLQMWGFWAPSDTPRSRPSLVPLLPLLLVLVVPAVILPPAFLFLLRRTVRPVLVATAVAIPFTLFVCGWWAFGASFEKFDAPDPWWAWFGRLVWVRRQRLEQTAAVVELSTALLMDHPPLLILTPLLLGVFALMSIPFLTMLIRLGTIGYWRHPKENTWNFHIRPYAGWLIFIVTLIWVWTWSVVRGVGRVAVAGVVGEWYFHRHEPSHPPPLDITTAAIHRATGASLGSVCLGAGIVAIARVVGRSAAELRRITAPRSNILPAPLSFLSGLTPVFTIIAGVLDQLNGYALVYVGITGDAFWPSARRAVGLVGRRKGGRLLDYTLIKLLLTLSSIAMGLFTGTAGYLYMSHSLVNPSYAPAAALLCGGVPFLAIRAGAAVLTDAADSLFICTQIDGELGTVHRPEAKEAFSRDRADRTTV
ncbi:plasma-membrane choline transporter-domain-containing protein [Papiliotrema laurentii]|uniref:Protein PNS1 n=1 Tax=Papiliotrema laurentii TaxID=5418 RepID=A0AAD9FU00_PAPLA|nr:plasma-membrane choline transporter-domain-containing protein [Papiliotrema laurentii]